MMPRNSRPNPCLTCRKRKVKCDGGKPTCDRCRKAYMICDGYKNSKALIFISQNDRFPVQQQRRSSGYINSPSPSLDLHASTDVSSLQYQSIEELD
ncbi:hypothetical protein BT63DRAFT_420585 [Microthyrium microscopicum]|uniref:Zn(2)-C6 fungal-type domain-containing protein n=1 Tax=Microthyrium microscopicum TaxID=703497 RepID=A0A6A6USR9_9PEZI|nr:hypothetical protein BT63DRAFT_420585 [Microthyrium microscopicum]